MNKVDFVKEYVNKRNSWERRTVLTALISCLDSDIAAQLLDPVLVDDQILRDIILNKVKRDIENEGCQHFHVTLIEQLISSFPSITTKRKQTCGYFLSVLYSVLPENIQRQIIDFFIKSSYITMRNRGYKLLRQNWITEYESIIKKDWHEYHDFYCAKLITDNFPATFLIENLEKLDTLLFGQAGYARLWIRVCEVDPNLLKRIEKRDGITFTYVMFILGNTLTKKQAFAIFSEYKFEDRIRLFIWCLGRMKLWSILEEIARNSDQLIQEKTDWFLKKYGIK